MKKALTGISQEQKKDFLFTGLLNGLTNMLNNLIQNYNGFIAPQDEEKIKEGFIKAIHTVASNDQMKQLFFTLDHAAFLTSNAPHRGTYYKLSSFAWNLRPELAEAYLHEQYGYQATEEHTDAPMTAG